MSHSSSPTTPQFSPTAAMLMFGKTSVVHEELCLAICCFAGKVMDVSYSFETCEFLPSVFSRTSAIFQARELLDWLLGDRTMQ
jgi:hypothetical protein